MMLSAQAGVVLEEFVEPKSNAVEAFDHLSTGFPLTGDHDLLECTQCHTSGRYEKLPTRCDACHNNARAQGIPAHHVKVTGPCDICHTTTGFIEHLVMDHRFVEGSCFTCHNGNSLKGKPVNHILASNLCEACHNTRHWTPVEKIDHSQLQTTTQWKPVNHVRHRDLPGRCVHCHQGDLPARHVRSRLPCGNCHFSRTAWRENVSVDHDELSADCETCHSAPNSHGAGFVHCADCHTARGFKAVRLDHAKVRAIACEHCHNGVLAETKPPKHCYTPLRCEVCHQTHSWDSNKNAEHGC